MSINRPELIDMYYDSDMSVWLSVDPMAGKHPSLSPYVYCAHNPIKYIDPDGQRFIDANGNQIGRASCRERV